MKRKTMYGIVALATIAVLIGGVSAFGQGLGFGVGNPDLSDEERAETQTFMEDVRTAIENEDYETWRSLMESQLTEENFQLLVDRHTEMQQVQDIREQMREAKESGDTETFAELRTQLQEMMPKGSGNGMFMGGKHGFRDDFAFDEETD